MMQPLEKSLRNQLERTVKEARDIAETAARASLEQLGVGEATPFSHLSPEHRELRRKLRIHGRQLGDIRDPKTETQEIIRLIEEVAYEQWHRMLFARFLAENNLLVLPDGSIPISLEECEDLAAEEGARNGWELASRFAAKMLPQIFRLDSPVFHLALPPEHEQKLEKLIANLPREVFTASDSIGWVYQFWQVKKKDEVNESGVKIGARELPSQTQLFTEPYMVNFLLDNSLGAWWATRRLSENDLKTAKTEEELRGKAAIPGVPLTYLRFVQDKNGQWTPAAGMFNAWPEHLKDLKTLDPCCGSGHFLVAALLMLVPIRMEMEGLPAKDAVDRAISENLHGLEIDQRCVELAAFALALTAWKYPNAGGYRTLPELAIACSGLAVSAKKNEWITLAGGNQDLEYALDYLHDQFSNAPVLGSLIDPGSFGKGNIVSIKSETLYPLLKKILSDQDSEWVEMGVVAQGIARTAAILSGKYHWIITNVPYLARGKQCESLRDFCLQYYPDAMNDIATVFLDRCLKLCHPGGVQSIVLPQNWLFLTTYARFRERLLKEEKWHLIARLGSGAFETISGAVVKAILVTISHEFPEENIIRGLDASRHRTVKEKVVELMTAEVASVVQTQQLGNPDVRIIFGSQQKGFLLENYAVCYQGLRGGDKGLLFRQFWEIPLYLKRWKYLQSSSKFSKNYGGMEGIIDILTLNLKYRDLGANYKRSNQWGKKGISISQMGNLPCTLYTGAVFDGNVNVFDVKDDENLPAVWAFCKSTDFFKSIQIIDQGIVITNSTLAKVPFDIDHWTKVAAEQYPNGLPKPYSDDPTQWIFHGHPAKSESPLQVAVARLLGYRWPAELDPEMELSDEQRLWVKKCDALLPFMDDEGIVCIPSVRGEPSAIDRLLSLLAVAYGDKWSNDVLSNLLTEADHEGKTLNTWMREKFFSQHCKLFHHRPFIWQIWDGLPDGFSTLVNYHKLDKKLLETLIYTYLGDWIIRQKRDRDNGIDGAEEKIGAAENLKKRLELILAGEQPYDIFVRWKSTDKQPIGWDPDLNDGVRLNIRPYMNVPNIGKKGAGVFREKPHIDWKKDRGKDVQSTPWYYLFNGDRINDHHLCLAEKIASRCKKDEENYNVGN